jgi:SAM-dependent methyltransferase
MLDDSSSELSRSFDRIYEQHTWGNGSGPGSEVKAARGYLKFLWGFLLEHRPKTVLDVGCGDCQLANAVRWDEWGADYVGIDVSLRAIHLAEHWKNKNLTMAQIDICSVTKKPYGDLAIVKDVFQHLPYLYVREALRNLSEYKHVLVTNDIPSTVLPDIAPGGYRPIDIRNEPIAAKAEVVWQGEIAGFQKQTLLITNIRR